MGQASSGLTHSGAVPSLRDFLWYILDETYVDQKFTQAAVRSTHRDGREQIDFAAELERGDQELEDTISELLCGFYDVMDQDVLPGKKALWLMLVSSRHFQNAPASFGESWNFLVSEKEVEVPSIVLLPLVQWAKENDRVLFDELSLHPVVRSSVVRSSLEKKEKDAKEENNNNKEDDDVEVRRQVFYDAFVRSCGKGDIQKGVSKSIMYVLENGTAKEVFLVMCAILHQEQENPGSVLELSIKCLKLLSFMSIPKFYEEALKEKASQNLAEEEDKINQVVGVTACRPEIARKALQISQWQPNNAIAIIFDDPNKVEKALEVEVLQQEKLAKEKEAREQQRVLAVQKAAETNQAKQFCALPGFKGLFENEAKLHPLVRLFHEFDRLIVESESPLKIADAPITKLFDGNVMTFSLLSNLLNMFTDTWKKCKNETEKDSYNYIIFVLLRLVRKNFQKFAPILKEAVRNDEEEKFHRFLRQNKVMKGLRDAVLATRECGHEIDELLADQQRRKDEENSSKKELIMQLDLKKKMTKKQIMLEKKKEKRNRRRRGGKEKGEQEKNTNPNLGSNHPLLQKNEKKESSALELVFNETTILLKTASPSFYACHEERKKLLHRIVKGEVPSYSLRQIFWIELGKDYGSKHFGFEEMDECIKAVVALEKKELENPERSVSALMYQTLSRLQLHVFHSCSTNQKNLRKGVGYVKALLTHAAEMLMEWSSLKDLETDERFTRYLKRSSVCVLAPALLVCLTMFKSSVLIDVVGELIPIVLEILVALSTVQKRGVDVAWVAPYCNYASYFLGKMGRALIVGVSPSQKKDIQYGWLNQPFFQSGRMADSDKSGALCLESTREVSGTALRQVNDLMAARCGREIDEMVVAGAAVVIFHAGRQKDLQNLLTTLAQQKQQEGEADNGEDDDEEKLKEKEERRKKRNEELGYEDPFGSSSEDSSDEEADLPPWLISAFEFGVGLKLIAMKALQKHRLDNKAEKKEEEKPRVLADFCKMYTSRAKILLSFNPAFLSKKFLDNQRKQAKAEKAKAEKAKAEKAKAEKAKEKKGEEEKGEEEKGAKEKEAQEKEESEEAKLILSIQKFVSTEVSPESTKATLKFAHTLANQRVGGFQLFRELLSISQDSQPKHHILKWIPFALRGPSKRGMNPVVGLDSARRSTVALVRQAFYDLYMDITEELDASNDLFAPLIGCWGVRLGEKDVEGLLAKSNVFQKILKVISPDPAPSDMRSSLKMSGTAYSFEGAVDTGENTEASRRKEECVALAMRVLSLLVAQVAAISQKTGGTVLDAVVQKILMSELGRSLPLLESAKKGEPGDATANCQQLVSATKRFYRDIEGMHVPELIRAPDSRNNVTFSMWLYLYPQHANNVQSVFFSGQGNNYRGLLISNRKLQYYHDTNNRLETVTSLKQLPLETWVHVVVTTRGKSMKLYIDGKKDMEKKNDSESRLINKFPLYIGCSFTCPQHSFRQGLDGLISDMRYIPTHASEDDVAALAESGPTQVRSDQYTYQVASLVYSVHQATGMDAALSEALSLSKLFRAVEIGTFRVQRVVLRLLSSLLPDNVSPGTSVEYLRDPASNQVQDVVSFFMNLAVRKLTLSSVSKSVSASNTAFGLVGEIVELLRKLCDAPAWKKVAWDKMERVLKSSGDLFSFQGLTKGADSHLKLLVVLNVLGGLIDVPRVSGEVQVTVGGEKKRGIVTELPSWSETAEVLCHAEKEGKAPCERSVDVSTMFAVSEDHQRRLKGMPESVQKMVLAMFEEAMKDPLRVEQRKKEEAEMKEKEEKDRKEQRRKEKMKKGEKEEKGKEEEEEKENDEEKKARIEKARLEREEKNLKRAWFLELVVALCRVVRTFPEEIVCGDVVSVALESTKQAGEHTLFEVEQDLLWSKQRVFDLRATGKDKPPLPIPPPEEDSNAPKVEGKTASYTYGGYKAVKKIPPPNNNIFGGFGNNKAPPKKKAPNANVVPPKVVQQPTQEQLLKQVRDIVADDTMTDSYLSMALTIGGKNAAKAAQWVMDQKKRKLLTKVQKLTGHVYPKSWCEKGLEKCGSDVELAAQWIPQNVEELVESEKDCMESFTGDESFRHRYFESSSAPRRHHYGNYGYNKWDNYGLNNNNRFNAAVKTRKQPGKGLFGNSYGGGAFALEKPVGNLITAGQSIIILSSRLLLLRLMKRAVENNQVELLTKSFTPEQFLRFLKLSLFRGPEMVLSEDGECKDLFERALTLLCNNVKGYKKAILDDLLMHLWKVPVVEYAGLLTGKENSFISDKEVTAAPNIQMAEWLLELMFSWTENSLTESEASSVYKGLIVSMKCAQVRVKYKVFGLITKLLKQLLKEKKNTAPYIKLLPVDRLKALAVSRFSHERHWGHRSCYSLYLAMLLELVAVVGVCADTIAKDLVSLKGPELIPLHFASTSDSISLAWLSLQKPKAKKQKNEVVYVVEMKEDPSNEPVRGKEEIKAPQKFGGFYQQLQNNNNNNEKKAQVVEEVKEPEWEQIYVGGSHTLKRSNLKACTMYNFRIKAKKGKTESGWSSVCYASTMGSPFVLETSDAKKGQGLAVNEKGNVLSKPDGGTSWRSVLGSSTYSHGEHYWEVHPDVADWGTVFFGIANPASFTVTNTTGHGFCNWRGLIGSSEQLYGEHFGPGNVIGVKLNMDKKEMSFFKDGKDLGVAFSKLGLDSVVPVFGLKNVGCQITVLADELFSRGGTPARQQMERVVDVVQVMNALQAGGEALPALFIKRTFNHHRIWLKRTVQRFKTRVGFYVTVNVSDSKLGDWKVDGVALRHGDLVSSPTGCKTILGVQGDHLWYREAEDTPHVWFWTRAFMETWKAEIKLLDKSKWEPGEVPKFIPFHKFEQVLEDTKIWTRERDVLICSSLDKACQARDCTMPNLDPNFFIEKILEGDTSSILKGVPKEKILVRAAFWREFNEHLADLLVICKFDEMDPMGIGARVASFREMIFLQTKEDALMDLLESTTEVTHLRDDEYTDPHNIHTIKVNRKRARKYSQDEDLEKRLRSSVFYQLHEGISKKNNWATMRQDYTGILDAGQSRTFKVTFLNEGVTDNGGPYREIFSEFCQELQSDVLPLLCQCPNMRAGVGMNREKYLFNSRCLSNPRNHELLKSVGRMIGIAVRCDIPLELRLPSMVWKRFVGQRPDEQDLKTIDQASYHLLQEMVSFEQDEESFQKMFPDMFFSTYTFDGKEEHELVEGGKNIPVTLANRHSFVDLFLSFKLKEMDGVMDLVVEGLTDILPANSLATFTSQEVERKICGDPCVDVRILRANCVYEGLKGDEQHVLWLWKLLEEMDEEERATFLQFVWARSRLPIVPSKGMRKDDPDSFLPTAHTCFFSISLPAYTSYDVLQRKVRYSMTHCLSMDADFRLHSSEIHLSSSM